MLPKKERLTKGDIDKIMKGGQKTDSPFFTLRYLSGQEDFKTSPVVSKKISKIAVKRNKARRWLYSLIEDLNLKKKGFHVIIFLKKGIDGREPEIKEDLKKIFNKI